MSASALIAACIKRGRASAETAHDAPPPPESVTPPSSPEGGDVGGAAGGSACAAEEEHAAKTRPRRSFRMQTRRATVVPRAPSLAFGDSTYIAVCHRVHRGSRDHGSSASLCDQTRVPPTVIDEILIVGQPTPTG